MWSKDIGLCHRITIFVIVSPGVAVEWGIAVVSFPRYFVIGVDAVCDLPAC